MNMTNILTIITEKDLRRYARGEVAGELAGEIEALIANDDAARDRLRAFAEQEGQQTGQSNHPQRKEHSDMPKRTKNTEHVEEFTATEARQAIESRTAKRVLIGGLLLIAIIAASVLAIGFSGFGDELNAVLPNTIVPGADVMTDGAS
jgi:anti-sigma factor RsiW